MKITAERWSMNAQSSHNVRNGVCQVKWFMMSTWRGRRGQAHVDGEGVKPHVFDLADKLSDLPVGCCSSTLETMKLPRLKVA